MAINFPNNPAVNDTFTVGGTTFTFTGVKWESSAVVDLSSDTTPSLGGTLEAGSHNINNVGVITANSVSASSSITAANFYGDGSSLTGLTGASAATYGNPTAIPQIVVNSNGKITGISNVAISGGGGGGGTSLIFRDSGSLVGSAGTIDFGTDLSVSPPSAGIVTITPSISELYHNGSKKFEAVSVGASVYGNLGVTGIATFGNGLDANNRISANAGIYIPAGLDISMGSGFNFYTTSNNAYTDLLPTAGQDIRIYNNGSNVSIQVVHSGSVQLKHSNNTKIETTSSGAIVTGVCTATSFDGEGVIPSGGIILWSGAANAIPTGWYLCDGQNSTPDLRNRFVVGAGDAYAVDATGGSADATLVSHTHNVTGNTNNTGSHSHSGNTNNTGDHTHSGNTNNTGSHAHRWGTDDNDGASGAGNPDANGGQSWKAWTDDQGAHSHNINTNNSGSHSHNINTNSDGSHSHNVTGTTDSQGSSATNANLPPYYALCYIMKS